MRIPFLALLIVLLPLRGWVGDAMAMEMMLAGTDHKPHATAAAAAGEERATLDSDPGTRTMHREPSGCPDHFSPNSGLSDDQHLAGNDHCDTCTACQICHSVALAPLPLQLVPARLAVIQPKMAAGHYASAERAPGFKPPIS